MVDIEYENPLVIRRHFAGTVAAGQGATEQWRYDVPGNRAARVQIMGVAARSSTSGDAQASIGDAVGALVFVGTSGTPVNAYAAQVLGGPLLLLPRHSVWATSQNTGTAATDMVIWLYAIEFDNPEP